jgi:predicted O-methyltransferase YrrM
MSERVAGQGLDPAVDQVLAEYEARAEREERAMREVPSQIGSRRDEWLLAVGRPTGMLLNILAKECRAQNIVEIGTSYGYSTVWLAEAARATGGRVISLEIHPLKVAYARERLAAAGLARCVEFRVGDARESRVSRGRFDFVLIDLGRIYTSRVLSGSTPSLSDGAIIVADNML